MLLLDFFSPNCTYCRQMELVLDDIEKEYKNKVSIKRIDATKAPDLSSIYGIRSLPTLVLMQNGTEIKRSTGSKTKAALREFISLA